MFNKVIDCSYNSNGLFKDTYFQRRKEPESERDESNKVNINARYYYYCNEC